MIKMCKKTKQKKKRKSCGEFGNNLWLRTRKTGNGVGTEDWESERFSRVAIQSCETTRDESESDSDGEQDDSHSHRLMVRRFSCA